MSDTREVRVLTDPEHGDNEIAYLYDADPRSVEFVLAAPVGEDPGRSRFTWIHLANGDLFLGVSPYGDTYLECVERLDGAMPPTREGV